MHPIITAFVLGGYLVGAVFTYLLLRDDKMKAHEALFCAVCWPVSVVGSAVERLFR